MSQLPRLQGITPDGQVIDLPELAEIQINWDEGLPATLLLSPEHLPGNSLSLEVGSQEDEEDHIEEYGVLVLRPGSCNVLDIEVETHRLDEDED
ncbi:hypothetical protein [Marinospirillum alkaliphilum]|uniref:Uncharacterized protein n=1 Tax=Marinospirillum alkaliphilum DSM 21637 TaxID=1122209 RepID=A0A1K1W5L8_9GAMM|nr:hypothetical protein [Marinospirillum alkaliphilum]SFX32109.1 hypothetical protein SAMN02745752_01270 [Marinospirillum alkaliphilum DSM 21637]